MDMDILGPIIVAFIVLIYYGLRMAFQPLIKRTKSYYESEAFNDEADNSNSPIVTHYEDEGIVFNDPLAESPTTPKKRAEPLRKVGTSSQSIRPTFTQVQSISSQIRKAFSSLNLTTDTNTQSSDSTTHQRPQSSKPAYPFSEQGIDTTEASIPTRLVSSQKGYAIPKHNLEHKLKTNLRSPHKKKFLREMFLMHEVLAKPVALRNFKDTNPN